MSARVAIIGLPFFGRRVAETLRRGGFETRYLPNPGRDLRAWPQTAWWLAQADLVYCIGSSVRLRGAPDVLARTGKRLLLHWAGTDVLDALDGWRARQVSPRVLTGATHWAVAPWLAEELAPLGIHAQYQGMPVPLDLKVRLPLPGTFRVLLYLPRRPNRAYNVEAYLSVVEALPEIPFVLVGGFEPPRHYANLEDAGYVSDMRAIYARTSASLRLMHHDGMSQTVLEALSYGRQVVWSYAFPGVTQVSSWQEAADALRRMAAERPGFNETGYEAAREFDDEHFVARTAAELRRLLR